MQTIIRNNSSDGIDPATGQNADKERVETAFVRVPLHENFHQACLSNQSQNLPKLVNHFFVDCDICYGFNSKFIVSAELQTVIFLNCKFSQFKQTRFPNYNGASPNIFVETIDDSCKYFTAAEKDANRQVIELTIQILCEQLKLVNIPEVEKMELINKFIQRRGVQNEDVLAALCSSGFDCDDFIQQRGLSNEQVLIALAKSNQDYLGFAQKKKMRDDQVLVALTKNRIELSDFMRKKGLTNDQIAITLVNSGLTNEQILVIFAKSQLNYQQFALNKGFTDEYTLITLMKARIDTKPFTAAKNMSEPEIISIIQNSHLSLTEKSDLLQQISLDPRSEQENINNALIKREYELTNERVLQFVNNKQRELTLEIVYKEAQLKQNEIKDQNALKEIKELKLKNQVLQTQNMEIKREYEQTIADIRNEYDAELIKCNNEVQTLRIEYQKDLHMECEKYKNEIEKLKQYYEIERIKENKLIELQQKQRPSDQEIDMNDTITKQLQLECQLLKKQQIEDKQYHDEQYEYAQQALKRATQRNSELQLKLNEVDKARLQFIQEMYQKQYEITKQLEHNVNEQAARIIQLESENQSLQSTLSVLREQIEKLNVQEYQKRIDIQTQQLEDKDEYITMLKEEMEKINVNQLQDKQIEKVLNILKSVEQ
ncbi:obscurin-like_isoform X4 [Hexamita inflata]|uniref:Obscurin-like isoform X4 n=1 Tax=Hexamita inflata TaxID=28002 RepID=A0AA86UXA8_9EUKA|nr:obscurin-like isoform X4 [Hexamita inflata]